MKIEADLATIYSLLNDEKPRDITVETAGGAVKAFNLSVNINIDLTMIANAAVVSWILARASVQGRSKMKVNGKLLPPDDAGARKMITDAVDADQNQNQTRE
jgi:carbon monoxide dehydrogenase subunit G